MQTYLTSFLLDLHELSVKLEKVIKKYENCSTLTRVMEKNIYTEWGIEREREKGRDRERGREKEREMHATKTAMTEASNPTDAILIRF